jgi:hypothetical protein
MRISEMAQLLNDTGWEHNTGECCTLSSLPISQLDECSGECSLTIASGSRSKSTPKARTTFTIAANVLN